MEGPRLLVSFLTLCTGYRFFPPRSFPPRSFILPADGYSFEAEELGMKQRGQTSTAWLKWLVVAP